VASLLSICSRQLPEGLAAATGPKPWQRGLDLAFLDVDAAPLERLQGLTEALSSPGEVAEAVGKAASAIATKGLREGHPEALDALWPKGTRARGDLEGLVAVVRQAPEVIEEFRPLASVASPPSPKVPTAAAALPRFLSPEGFAEAADEVKNVFRSTPSGLEEPAYEVLRKTEAFELRRYAPFTIARRKMGSSEGDGAASSEGFLALAGYLFGDNAEDRSMKMTMPVEISYDDSIATGEQTMAFVLPAADATVGPPAPRDPSVEVAGVAERLVAVKEFQGVATAGEVKRQTEKLLAALQADGALAPTGEGQRSVLQYNPPYTLPWRRRNEIAVVVTDILDRAEEAKPEAGVEAVALTPGSEAEAEAAASASGVGGADP